MCFTLISSVFNPDLTYNLTHDSLTLACVAEEDLSLE